MKTIDEAAEALGVNLLPWQREVGQRILNGEHVVMVGGRGAGRTTLRRVVNHALGDVEIRRGGACGCDSDQQDHTCGPSAP